MKNFIITLIFFTAFFSYGQTASEKEILNYLNHVRTNPKSFLNNIAIPFIKEKELTRNRYAKSLIKDLETINPLDSLKFESSLQKMAEDFAEEAGKKGWTSHMRVEKRFKKYANHVDIKSENLQFGFDKPLDIVMDLLIDTDIPDLGHRKNILDADFTIIGVATSTHKDYEFITVMNFGGFNK